jgi:hypothetical protein
MLRQRRLRLCDRSIFPGDFTILGFGSGTEGVLNYKGFGSALCLSISLGVIPLASAMRTAILLPPGKSAGHSRLSARPARRACCHSLKLFRVHGP